MKRKNYDLNKGSATLEILIAFTVIILCMSAVILVSFGNQSVSVDSQINNEAIYKAGKILEDARALSRQNYLNVLSTTSNETVGGLQYNKALTVIDVTACKKEATSTVTWTTSGRVLKIELGTFFTDVAGALALGGDCSDVPPGINWNNPKKFASDSINPGKSTAIDSLNRMVYLGADKDPFFYIASTTYATLGQSTDLFVTFTNGFTANDTIDALDAIHDIASGKNYVFAAMASSTAQLIVIDVTDVYKPVIVATRRLSSCVAGSAPEGWRVRYYKSRLYLTTRFTAGPEFHIFDVSNPTNPTEFSIGSVACKGLELGDTVNDITVAEQTVAGVTKKFAYLATDESNKELRVYDVTSSSAPVEVLAANQDLPGIQNGQSVYLYGNKLFFGRQSTPGGPDLYIYDARDTATGLPLLGSQDINTGALEIRIAGRYAFIATPKASQEFQIWDISNPLNIFLIKAYNFGNIVDQGIDYEPDWIYSTGQATPNFQILYNQ